MTIVRRLLTFIFLCFVFVNGRAQCLSPFTKLVPEPVLNYAGGFGSSISMHNEFLAVGSSESDSVGLDVGVASIYQRQPDNTWKKIAAFAPSDPQADLGFGSSVKLSENYLAVGASGYGGRIYVFKKPAGGWATAIENYKLIVAGSIGLALSPIDPIDISDDERTLAIVDTYKSVSQVPPRSGVIHLFRRQSNEEWSDHPPTTIPAPEDNVADFGRAGVHILNDRIVTGTPLSPQPYGTIYIYRDQSGEFNNPTLEARLTANPTIQTNGLFTVTSLVVLDEGIVASAPTYPNMAGGGGIIYFKKPPTNVWVDAEPTCFFRTNLSRVSLLTTNGTDIFARYNANGNSHFGVLKKGSADWCNPTIEILKTIPAAGVSSFSSLYASRITASGANVVTGMAILPGPETPVALEAFRKNGSSWSSTIIHDSRKTTTGHNYGQALLIHDNYLFVSSLRDGTMKPADGAVYIYENQETSWVRVNKILPMTGGQYDEEFGFAFGSSLAANKTQLAISAVGFGPEAFGKVFIYNKSGSNWQNPVLVQEIELPDHLGLNYSGYHVAMSDNWLVIPHGFPNPAQSAIAIYKKQSNRWEYYQSVACPDFGLFEPTLEVDIDGETIVASSSVIEKNTAGVWQIVARLTPSDPEPFKLSPDMSHLETNGNWFGAAIDIQGDNIFIGAPRKDFGSTWDVGAVYVFTKRPGTAWTNMQETTKIIPRVKEENALFGYSLDALENTLIVGAPGHDYFLDAEQAPLNKTGRSYMFQSRDYFWNDVASVQEFTGDTSIKDFFGASVGLGTDNFAIGASIEELLTGKLSGSVYVSSSPAMVSLVPPVCINAPDVVLSAFPVGGTWSGPGVSNGAEHRFSPTAVGLGTHELEYVTATCPNAVKLLIKVDGPVSVTPTTPTDIIVCDTPALSVPLAVTEETNANYQWYYRAADGDFAEINEHAATMSAKNPGEYYVEVFNGGCSLNSPVTNIHSEELEVEIDPPTGCIQPATLVALTASPPGGVWSGAGTNGAEFSMTTPGSYPVTYTYVSARNCSHSKSISIEVAPQLKVSVTPDVDKIEVCYGSKATLSATAPVGTTVSWSFLSSPGQTPLTIHNTATIEPSEQGYYFAEVSNGTCTTVTDPVQVVMLAQDSLQAPNVFTPNGDGKNDSFVVSLHSENRELTIFNRYGGTIFQNKTGGSWDGGDQPAGVYFWVATVPGCEEERTASGFVHLLR